MCEFQIFSRIGGTYANIQLKLAFIMTFYWRNTDDSQMNVCLSRKLTPAKLRL